MAMENNRRRQQSRGFVISNRTLLILVCALSAVLVVLLIIGGFVTNMNHTDPTGDMLQQGEDTGTSTPSDPSSQPPSSEITQPTTVPSTEPTTTPPTPSGGDYVNVGSGYIAEVIQVNVETFDGDTYDDYSHPTNNYLPEGTVDYCASEIVYGSGMKYVQLRSGHRVYLEKKIYPPVRKEKEVKQYEGWLPDHNEISVVSLQTEGRHSVLTLDCLWKAPFYFEFNQSGYANPDGGSSRDYAISGNNISYIDITFCYATSFSGKVTIPADHPLFKSAEVIKNESDYTLRLFLRKSGGFYGWYAYYNENDQLCFQFLNPAKVSVADNQYGANLSGVTVMIDVGHGGVDGGAVGTDADGNQYEEADVNLTLANALKAELESMGATVIMNRYDDTAIDINARQEDLIAKSPDICVAIHQNSYSSANVSGFDSMYFTPWSHLLAKNIHSYTNEAGIYSKAQLKWSVGYFMMRQSVCPVVLTENGYMSNPDDLAGMIDSAVVQNKAVAIAHGIADYFLEINK